MRSPFVAAFMSVSLLALCPLPAMAEAKPAPLAELVKAVDIPYEAFTLKNGLRVLVHTDRKAPVVGVTLYYRVGSKNEPHGKTGFAHLYEHLFFGGSATSCDGFFDLRGGVSRHGNVGHAGREKDDPPGVSHQDGGTRVFVMGVQLLDGHRVWFVSFDQSHQAIVKPTQPLGHVSRRQFLARFDHPRFDKTDPANRTVDEGVAGGV